MSDAMNSNPVLSMASDLSQALQLHWRSDLTLINLRGDPQDCAFRQALLSVLGLDLPESGGGMTEGRSGRLIEVGPDDWFFLAPAGQADSLMTSLRQALAGLHAAVTDVSSGYLIVRVSGPAAAEVLAQGCPLDLHPRALRPGRCLGSHFFKASIWLWPSQPEPGFELMVRRSFRDYVALMLARAAGIQSHPRLPAATAARTGSARRRIAQ